jgi:hypothetical protein
MLIDEYERQYGPLDVDGATRLCMEWLERVGQRFLVDFGWENAKQKAVAEAARRIRERRISQL